MEKQKEYVLSAYALIPNNKGQYLLLKRSKKQTHNPNEWDLPGGKADGDETLQKALLREVAEETSLKIDIEGVAGTATFELPTLKVVALVMEATALTGDVILSHEHDEYIWATFDQIGKMQIPDHLSSFFRKYMNK